MNTSVIKYECFIYFSIAITKHHDQGNIYKELL